MRQSSKNDNKEEVGYSKPPASTRFRKGKSGNPKGRPKGSRFELPYDAVLGQLVTIRQGGQERQVTAEEAFLLQLSKKGLEGDVIAARQSMEIIEKERDAKRLVEEKIIPNIVVSSVAPGCVCPALEPLRMAKKLDRYRSTVRMMLEPWIIAAALARLGDRQLSLEEQKVVVEATRTPHKVAWPDWWEV